MKLTKGLVVVGDTAINVNNIAYAVHYHRDGLFTIRVQLSGDEENYVKLYEDEARHFWTYLIQHAEQVHGKGKK